MDLMSKDTARWRSRNRSLWPKWAMFRRPESRLARGHSRGPRAPGSGDLLEKPIGLKGLPKVHVNSGRPGPLFDLVRSTSCQKDRPDSLAILVGDCLELLDEPEAIPTGHLQ